MKNIIGLLSLLFTINNAFAGCDPCKCGYGGLNPWPDELIRYCNSRGQNSPSPSSPQDQHCISKTSARDILSVNLELLGVSTETKSEAIRNLEFSVRKKIYNSQFSVDHQKEEIGISCTGVYESTLN